MGFLADMAGVRNVVLTHGDASVFQQICHIQKGEPVWRLQTKGAHVSAEQHPPCERRAFQRRVSPRWGVSPRRGVLPPADTGGSVNQPLGPRLAPARAFGWKC